jgi:hypothetical protein
MTGYSRGSKDKFRGFVLEGKPKCTHLDSPSGATDRQYSIHEDKRFELTWHLDPEGSPEEETRIRSGSAILFFGGGNGFGRSFSIACSMIFSCESAVCSRVES